MSAEQLARTCSDPKFAIRVSLSAASVQYNTLPFLFFFQRLVFTTMCFPFILSTGVQNKALWCSRGWSESSLHSLSNYFHNDQLVRLLLHLREEKEKARRGGKGGSILFLVTAKITHSFLYMLPFINLFFQFLHFRFSSSYLNGSNNLADWDLDVGREQVHCGPVSRLSVRAGFNRFFFFLVRLVNRPSPGTSRGQESRSTFLFSRSLAKFCLWIRVPVMMSVCCSWLLPTLQSLFRNGHKWSFFVIFEIFLTLISKQHNKNAHVTAPDQGTALWFWWGATCALSHVDYAIICHTFSWTGPQWEDFF